MQATTPKVALLFLWKKRTSLLLFLLLPPASLPTVHICRLGGDNLPVIHHHPVILGSSVGVLGRGEGWRRGERGSRDEGGWEGGWGVNEIGEWRGREGESWSKGENGRGGEGRIEEGKKRGSEEGIGNVEGRGGEERRGGGRAREGGKGAITCLYMLRVASTLAQYYPRYQ